MTVSVNHHGGSEVNPCGESLRVLQETGRVEKEVRGVPATQVLRQRVPKKGLEEGAQKSVQEAAAGVCAAGASVWGR